MNRRLSLFLVMILVILLAEKKAEPEDLDPRDLHKFLEKTVKSDKAVVFEVKAGQVKGAGPLTGISEIKKQEAFIVAFFDGIRKIAEGIADKKGKITVIQKDNIITTNTHEKIGDFEVDSKTEVKIVDEKTGNGELISDHIEINYMAQKYVIQNFMLTSPPAESVKFIKWNNPPKTISGIKIHGVNWVDKTAEVIISYPEGTKLAESQKPSSKAQSNDKSSEAKNSVPTKDSEDNENGWKNLKWGMTEKEVLKFYKDLPFLNIVGEYECGGDNFRLKQIGVTINPERNEALHYYSDVSELTCLPSGGGWYSRSGILFYKGKFFGKILTLDGYKNNEKTQNIIITQLKEKYPNGEISSYVYGYKAEGIFGIETYEYKHETEVGILEKMRADIKIPLFEYKSNKITVFINKDFDLYFYDTKVLDELVIIDREQQKKNEDEKTNKTKQLF